MWWYRAIIRGLACCGRRMSLPAETPAATWQLQTFDPSAISVPVPTPLSTGGAVETWQPQTFDPSPIGVPVPTPLSTEGAAETGQLAPTPTGSAATAGPAWEYTELMHTKVEITQRRAVAMAWKLRLFGPARLYSISAPMTLFDDHVAKCATRYFGCFRRLRAAYLRRWRGCPSPCPRALQKETARAVAGMVSASGDWLSRLKPVADENDRLDKEHTRPSWASA